MLSFATVGARWPEGSDWARFDSQPAATNVLTTSERTSGIVAGQGPVRSDVVSQSQTVALTLSAIQVFPMTHHVECVAVLEREG